MPRPFPEARERVRRIEDLAAQADRLAAMDFRLLYDPARKLLSIGWSGASIRNNSGAG